jgi:HSF-type DNA-binding
MCVTNTRNRRAQAILSLGPALLLTGNLAQEPDLKHRGVQVVAIAPVPSVAYKPQKPGLTANDHERHFVVHNYHDHSQERPMEGDVPDKEDHHPRRRGVTVPFPIRLHAVLLQVEADGLGHVISWMPHGRCFVIHQPKEFAETVMPTYFRQTKLTRYAIVCRREPRTRVTCDSSHLPPPLLVPSVSNASLTSTAFSA